MSMFRRKSLSKTSKRKSIRIWRMRPTRFAIEDRARMRTRPPAGRSAM